jgi:hypothetical protein
MVAACENMATFIAVLNADDAPGIYGSTVQWLFGPVGLQGRVQYHEHPTWQHDLDNEVTQFLEKFLQMRRLGGIVVWVPFQIGWHICLNAKSVAPTL